MVMRKIETGMLKDFALFLKIEEKSAATIEKYVHDVRCFAEFVGAEEVSKQTVVAYKNKLGSAYAAASANSMLAALNSFLRFCNWQDLCVKPFRVQRQAYCSEEKELTKGEYIRLLEAAKKKNNERLNLLIQTICATGIRVSELAYITVEAVRCGQAAVFCKGKTRVIFIVSALQKKLLRYARAQHIASGVIFVTKSGKPMNRSNIWREMKALCQQANVMPSKVFPHNLRHLFARVFYGMEKDIAKLADILGHSSINTTRLYIVSSGTEHKRCMETMHLIL